VTADIVERLRRSARYRDVDPALLDRLAGEELPRARSVDDAVKRVKRRLHQAVGAYRGVADPDRVLAPIRAAWSGDLADEAFRAACRTALARHASTAERLPHLDRFFPPIWELTGGPPRTLVDLGCGLGPLSLPWMGLAADATYRACDADRRSLAVVEGFLALVGQPAAVEACDLVEAGPPPGRSDVALLLKLVPLLDHQDPSAAARCLGALDAAHAVVSFPARSLGGRRRGMEGTYRRRLDGLIAEGGIREVGEASVPNELVFVLRLDG
jgi:16S rRNA (guanine(1405)-N(7))-methyltransferase